MSDLCSVLVGATESKKLEYVELKRLNSSSKYSSAQSLALKAKLVKGEKKKPAVKRIVMHTLHRSLSV